MRIRSLSIQAVLLLSLFGTGYAGAAEAEKNLTGQQKKMVSCAQQAKDKALKGFERQTFMSTCLRAKNAGANRQADSKKGDEREQFMKECLSAAKM
jgi:psiF repeat-containing protein